MKTWLSIAVVVLGLVVIAASAIAMVNYGITADETGISGWNPPLWILLFTGGMVVLVGIVQLAMRALEPSR